MNHTLSTYVVTPLRNTFYTLFIAPFHELYLNGPSFAKGLLGGWEGVPEAAICYEITHVEESFWMENRNACHELVERKFYGFVWLIVCIAYAWLLLQAIIAGTDALRRRMWRGG